MSYPFLTRSAVRPAAAVASESGAPTVTVTQAATATSNPYDSKDSNPVSKIVPGVLIAFFCFTTVCLAVGLIRMRRRRRQRMFLAESSSNTSSADSGIPKPKKQKQRLMRPKLWDVETKDGLWDADLEALRPVAVELQADAWPASKPVPSVQDEQKRGFMNAFSRGHKPQEPSVPMQQAQVTFFVSMPTPHRRQGEPSRDIALGTTSVPYQDDESDDEDDETLQKILDSRAVLAV